MSTNTVICTATRHDTSQAYRKAGCKCPKARAGRKKGQQLTRLLGLTIAAVPPFKDDPRRHCADLANPDVMFPERPADVADALAICAGCPLKQQCAQWALDTRQMFGVYGGVTAVTRRKQIASSRLQVAA